MNNYRNEILNEFIDRYEKSSYYKGKSEKPRKISIVLHKSFLNMDIAFIMKKQMN